MSLSVNGLKIKKGKENCLEEIVSILTPIISKNMEKRAKKEMNDIYEKLLSKFYKEKKEDCTFHFGDFFENDIFIYVKKEELPLFFFEGSSHISFTPYFIKSILESNSYSFDSFKLKFCPTKSSDDILIILPFDLNLKELPSELEEYCILFSASNSTDDIPSHFKNRKEWKAAIDLWYSIDDMTTFISRQIETKIDVEEWLFNIDLKSILSKSSSYDAIYNRYYKPEEDNRSFCEIVDHLIELKTNDELFKERVEEDFKIKVKDYEKIHEKITSSIKDTLSNLKAKGVN